MKNSLKGGTKFQVHNGTIDKPARRCISPPVSWISITLWQNNRRNWIKNYFWALLCNLLYL